MQDDTFEPREISLSASFVRRIDQVCDRFEAAWEGGREPEIEDYLPESEQQQQSALLYRLLVSELDCRRRRGETPEVEVYRSRFPRHVELVEAAFATLETPPKPLAETISFPGSEAGPHREKPLSSASEVRGQKFGRFELLSVLGRGAFGVVYRAHDPRLDRDIALKIPRAWASDRREELERFLREARAAAQLRHSNIVPVHEAGTVDETPFIASDFIEGKTLRTVMHDGESISSLDAARLVAKLARALHYAHTRGVIHRDIKPENIILDADGEPQITDFGLARRERGQSLQTREGVQMGTPAYMSPEQARGESHLADARSDLWSLGVILYELLAGIRPFSGEEPALMAAILSADPASPRRHNKAIPKDLETICLKCLRKEPDHRYPSCEDLAKDLDRYCEGEPISARRQSLLVRVCRKAARRPVLSSTIIAALLALVLSGFLIVRAGHDWEIADLLQDLNALIDAGNWSATSLAQIDAKLAELDQLDVESGVVVRGRLLDRFAADIAERLESPALSPEDSTEIRGWLELLDKRASERAESLYSQFEGRLRRWDRVIELNTPFEDYEAVFPRGEVIIRNQGMQAVKSVNAERTPMVFMRIESGEAARLTAVFGDSWKSASTVGMSLHAAIDGKSAPQAIAAFPEDNLRGYHFVLSTTPTARTVSGNNGKPSPSSFAETSRENGGWIAKILRDNTCLRKERITAVIPPSGELTLAVEQDGPRLSFRAAGIFEIEFFDLEPYRRNPTGVFAVIWPRDVCMSQLTGSRRLLSTNPSPLELGDSYYAQNKYQEAEEFYAKQAETAAAGDFINESEFKRALCLRELNRSDEAERILESLAVKNGELWPALAACTLWRQWARAKDRVEKTEDLIRLFRAQFALEELPRFVPYDLQREIVLGHGWQGQKLNLANPKPQIVHHCELAMTFAELFDCDTDTKVRAAFQLTRAYHMAGQQEEALEVAETALRTIAPGEYPYALADLIPDYCWLLRIQGRAEEALKVVDEWLTSPRNPRSDWWHAQWRVERVRVLCALERWDEAETALDSLFQEFSPVEMSSAHAQACMLRGFLHLRRGDDIGAQQEWKAGLDPSIITEGTQHDAGFPYLHCLILASLTNGLSEDEAKAAINWVLLQVSPESNIGQVVDVMADLVAEREAAPIINGVFQSKRGQEWARQIAFREIPFPECFRVSLIAGARELIRHEAFGRELSAEEDPVIWGLAEDACDAVLETRTLGKSELFLLAITWKGVNNSMTWPKAAETLDKQIRGPIAYAMGHRYLRLGRPNDAAEFFQAALKDASVDSTLQTLARSDLERLGVLSLE